MSKKDTRQPNEVLESLLLELAVRSDNDHVGSGRGGNVSELFFLMSHTLIPRWSKSDFQIRETDRGIEFCTNGKAPMSLVRESVTNFINQHPDKNSYTQEQITNPSFLRDLRPTSPDVLMLIKALEIGDEVVGWLDQKMALIKEIAKSFSKEEDAIEKQFLAEMNLPSNLFDKVEKPVRDEEILSKEAYESGEYDDWEYSTVGEARDCLNRHPNWGTRLKEIRKRRQEIEKLLISQEDLDKLNVMSSTPSYITLLAFRTKIGIDRLVALNIDERVEALNRVNKKVDR